MTNEIAIQSTDLEALAGIARETNKGVGNTSIPVMKIQYDEDAKTERGVFVVGQKKNEKGEIEDEGKVVKGFIILAVRDRYSLFDNKNKQNNCSSIMFLRGDRKEIRGHKHGHVCGGECPWRDKSLTNYCKAQKVVFAIAICEDGSMVECVSYWHGNNYMPLADHVEKQLTRVVVNGKPVETPMFAWVNKYSTRKEKNQGTTFWVASLERAGFVGMDRIQKYAETVKNVVEPMIEDMNRRLFETKDNDAAPAVASAPAPVRPVAAPAPATPSSVLDTMDTPPWNDVPKAVEPEVLPGPTPKASSSDGDWEKEIENMLNGVAA